MRNGWTGIVTGIGGALSGALSGALRFDSSYLGSNGKAVAQHLQSRLHSRCLGTVAGAQRLVGGRVILPQWASMRRSTE